METAIEQHKDRMQRNVATTADILQIMDNKLLDLFDELCQKDTLLKQAELNATSNGALMPDGTQVSKNDIKAHRQEIQQRIIELKDSIAKGAGKTPQTNIQINQTPNEALLSLLNNPATPPTPPPTDVPCETLDIDIDNTGIKAADDLIDTIIGDKQ